MPWTIIVKGTAAMNASAGGTGDNGRAPVQWSADPDCLTIESRLGKILIEGAVFRVDGRNGRRALDRLAEMIDSEGPAALAKAEGDFVALIIADEAAFAFKSFTSQYQLYYE